MPTTDALPPWANKVLDAGLDDAGDAARVDLLAQMQKLARSEDVSPIDTILKQTDVAALSVVSLITLLRGTFSFRERLNNWDDFRDRIALEFETRGIDPEVLRGLSDPQAAAAPTESPPKEAAPSADPYPFPGGR